ncbi:MAG: 3'-5' exonuclease [Desulfosarcinaceae bacterium]|jgi:DNA polymerase-3 subunit epsilon
MHKGNTGSFEAVAIDVETTGLSPVYGHRVIEIAAVRIAGNCLGETFHSLIDCGRKVSPGAWRVHGITDAMLVDQPPPAMVFEQFRRFIGNRDLVAHNASFDRAFLRYEYGRLGWQFTSRMHCTLALSRKLLPGLADHRLETVFRHLFPGESETLRLHRALDDACAAGTIWRKISRY